MRSLLLLLLLFAAAPSGAATLNLVCATNDLGAIAAAVGGEHVSVDVVARSDRDPHTVEVRPSTMRKTAKADMYLEVGLSLDLWSRDIVRGSRNRDITVIDCSEAVAPLEVPHGRVDASMGDVHPEGNPHYWLDPINAGAVARLLAEAFSAKAPEHADVFRGNAQAFAARLEAPLEGWRSRLEGRSLIEFHRTWAYWAHRFGMTIVGQVEPLPGIPPTARHLAKLADLIRDTGAAVVVRDVYHADSSVEFLERETGIRSVVLKASCDEPTPESFFEHYQRIVDTLGADAPGEGKP